MKIEYLKKIISNDVFSMKEKYELINDVINSAEWSSEIINDMPANELELAKKYGIESSYDLKHTLNRFRVACAIECKKNGMTIKNISEKMKITSKYLHELFLRHTGNKPSYYGDNRKGEK